MKVDDLLNQVEWEKIPREKARAARVLIQAVHEADRKGSGNDARFDAEQVSEALYRASEMLFYFLMHDVRDDRDFKQAALFASAMMCLPLTFLKEMNNHQREMVMRAIHHAVEQSGLPRVEVTF